MSPNFPSEIIDIANDNMLKLLHTAFKMPAELRAKIILKTETLEERNVVLFGTFYSKFLHSQSIPEEQGRSILNFSKFLGTSLLLYCGTSSEIQFTDKLTNIVVEYGISHGIPIAFVDSFDTEEERNENIFNTIFHVWLLKKGICKGIDTSPKEAMEDMNNLLQFLSEVAYDYTH